MGKDYTSMEYRDGGYSIGEVMPSDHYISGLGLIRWPDSAFAMGQFLHNHGNGWVCYVNAKGELTFNRMKDNTTTDTAGVFAYNEFLAFYEFFKSEKGGCLFKVYSDGTWLFRRLNGKDEVRTIDYNAQDKCLYMGIMQNGETKICKTIGKGEIRFNLSLRYTPFNSDSESTLGEVYTEYNMASTDYGAVIATNDDDTQTVISSNGGPKDMNGITYILDKTSAAIFNMESGQRNGPGVSFSKDGSAFMYTYWEDGTIEPKCVCWNDDGSLEVRLQESKDVSSIIAIDNESNVTFIKHYNTTTKKAEKTYYYHFDQIVYEQDNQEVEEEVEEKPTKRKPKKSSGGNSDITDELFDLFKKKSKR